MRIRLNTSLVLSILAAAGCSQPVKDKSPDPGPPTTGPVMVQIVSRDVTIVARAGENGPVYSVQSKDGQTLVGGMTLDELHANEPRLARHIQSMHASGAEDELGAWGGIDLE